MRDFCATLYIVTACLSVSAAKLKIVHLVINFEWRRELKVLGHLPPGHILPVLYPPGIYPLVTY